MNAPQVISDNAYKVKDALDVWADWYKSDDSIACLGVEISSIYGDPVSVKSWADLEHSGDVYLAENMNALIDGLPGHYQTAVFNVHIAQVFSSKRRDYDQEADYDNAIFALAIGMRKRYLL
jgi:hypothetical protein